MDGLLDTVRHLAAPVVLALATLLPLVDPLASVPIYAHLTAGLAPAERSTLARSVAQNSFVLLLASAFVGAYVLDFFGLSIPAVQIGGGIVLCAMGWKLLTGPELPDAASLATAAGAVRHDTSRRAFYPLTMPLTVGPGSISVAVALGANPNADVRSLLITAVGHTVGILIVAASVYLCYRYSDRIVRTLGETGRSVVIRLSAFIVLCIGVQIAWNGVHALLVGAFPAATR